ncbi:histidine kinase [Duganella sp. LX20W]|uniref:Histidine kinase n=1 Tax=Rugamonas brunnea TaxID=2758569 RepID=A0A7W2IAE7_9BURK|nr:histidine kinase [Rugamonas brunnea]MBA5635817.1 histidine kinase [Rugamonas brunnea]
MPGLFASRRGALVYLALWLTLGLMLGGVIALADAAPLPNALLFAVPLNLMYAFVAGFSAYYLCRAYPLGRAPLPLLCVLAVAAAVAGLLWLGLAQLWNALCLLPAMSWAGIVIGPQLAALVAALGMLLYGLATAIHYLVIEFVRAQTAEQGALAARLAAQEAELRMLRTQIDPHFLFNSLNSISALSTQDPPAARSMTLELASFFRHSLGMDAQRKVALERELALVRHFLAIERQRFGARLAVREDIAPDAACCLVPPMIVQPLVENAVKHGIGQLPEGGVIMLTARRAGSLLRIRVENDVDASLPAARGNGVGLANVRQRLAGLYGHEASIHWSRRDDRFGVELSMPAETSGD